jgi:hypothetical protein
MSFAAGHLDGSAGLAVPAAVEPAAEVDETRGRQAVDAEL